MRGTGGRGPATLAALLCVAVNAALVTYETAWDDFMDGLQAADRRAYRLVFADVWRGVTATTNLNAKFPDVAAEDRLKHLISVPIKIDTASNDNIIWAIPGVNIGRIPLTFRVTNAAGEIAYS